MATMNSDSSPIVLTYEMSHSKENIWKALTEIGIMKDWYFDQLADFRAEVDFETSFTLENEGRSFTHQWKVTEVTPLKSLTYLWTFAEYKGSSSSTFEILDHGRLQITITILESFPEQVPEFDEASCIGGWNWLIDRLKAYNFG